MRVLGSHALALALLVPCAGGARGGEAEAHPTLFDAQQAMETILDAIERLPAQVQMMQLTERAATIGVVVEDQGTFDHVRAALEATGTLHALSRDPHRVVEMGAMRFDGGRWRCDLVVRFRADAGPPAPPDTAAHISRETMERVATEAGLRQVRLFAEHTVRRDDIAIVSQRVEYEGLHADVGSPTLPSLRGLCRRIAETKDHRVTEILWTRAPGTGESIETPRIEISVWRREDRALEPAEAEPAMPDAYAIMRRVLGATHDLPVRVEGMSLQRTSVDLSLSHDDQSVREKIKGRLLRHPYFRGRGGDEGGFLRLDPIRFRQGRWLSGLTLRLDPDRWDGAPPRSADEAAPGRLEEALAASGLRIARAGQVSAATTPDGTIEVLTLSLLLASAGGVEADLTLARLEAFLSSVSRGEQFAVTAITWKRASDTGDQILGPRVEISSWRPHAN